MPQPAREALEELQALVEEHKWWRNGFRVNLDREESHRRRDRNGREWLKYSFAPRSNTIREGPILECVQQQLGPHINAVCLNKKHFESPVITKHTDGKNAGPSWVCLWGDFEGGGELCLEDGTVYAERNIWHGPMEGGSMPHWVNPHTSGTRFSAVAFTGPPAPRTRPPAQKKKRAPQK